MVARNTRSAVAPYENCMLNTNIAWQNRKDSAIARGEYNLAPVFVKSARGSEIWDVEGRRYVDFGAGIAVCNTGHSHPKITKAVKEQIDHFSHTCIMVTPYDSAVRLAEALNKIAPGDTPKKSMFVTTGAEAVENAVKIARAHTGRSGVIAFTGGYHGRTNYTLGLTGKNIPYKQAFGPFPSNIYRVPFPNSYHGVSVEQTFEAIETLFTCDIPAKEVAAIIIEPVQGEGGFYPAPNSFLLALRTLCDVHGIMLIADEIQTGFGRTGKMFAMEHSGVEADLMTIAKGMAGGYPIAGVVGKANIMDAAEPGGLGGTYAGSPIGCAAALAVLNIIEEERLIDASNHISELFAGRLQALKTKFPQHIGDVRTDRGAMIAAEFVSHGDSNQPDTEIVKELVLLCYESGLIILKCGIRGNVIRFLPSLTISESLVHEGLDIFENALQQLVDEKP